VNSRATFHRVCCRSTLVASYSSKQQPQRFRLLGYRSRSCTETSAKRFGSTAHTSNESPQDFPNVRDRQRRIRRICRPDHLIVGRKSGMPHRCPDELQGEGLFASRHPWISRKASCKFSASPGIGLSNRW
jgi:hypothetical protein